MPLWADLCSWLKAFWNSCGMALDPSASTSVGPTASDPGPISIPPWIRGTSALLPGCGRESEKPPWVEYVVGQARRAADEIGCRGTPPAEAGLRIGERRTCAHGRNRR